MDLPYILEFNFIYVIYKSVLPIIYVPINV